MATVSSLVRAAGGAGNPGAKPYLVQKEIDLAAAATAKGSALAANDIIQAITVGAGTMILNAGIEVVTAAAGGSSCTLDLGVTGIDVDVFADGFDIDGASAGDYSQNPAAYQPVVIGSAADTIDVLCLGTTVATSGKIRVWAVLMGVGDEGDTSAAEVDRDQLA